MRLLIDMDDTIENLCTALVPFLNKRHGTNVKYEDVNEWDLTKAFPMLSKAEVFAPFYEDEFWSIVQPLPGAQDGIKNLIDKGHDVFIVTSSFYETLRAKMDELLFKYFPYLNWDQVIITSNKQMIHGDVLVDDGVHNLIGGDYIGVLYDAPHNRSFNEKEYGIARVHDWDEVVALIDSMEAEVSK